MRGKVAKKIRRLTKKVLEIKPIGPGYLKLTSNQIVNPKRRLYQELKHGK